MKKNPASRKAKISLVIPALNEERALPVVFKNLPQRFFYEVIVVNQYSKDNTARIAQQNGAKVIYEKKRGYGYAYLAGFQKARGDLIATLDGDGTYDPQEIKKMFFYLKKWKADFISGDRLVNVKKEAMPKTFLFGNHLISYFQNILFGTKIHDTQSGMWLFKRSLLKEIVLKEGRMGFSSEIKLKFFKKSRFREIPITYYPRYGQKKLNILRHVVQVLGYLFKERM